MAEKPPFDFDISVSSDKKKRRKGRRGMSGAFETSSRKCDHPGCDDAGKYRAPKSPDRLDEFYWFCMQHVREFNANWNYFANVPEDELEQRFKDSKSWGQTKPLGSNPEAAAWQRFGINDAHEVLGDKATRRREGSDVTRRLPPTERKALGILDAKDSMTKSEIRKVYKSLVKDLHPDMNGGKRDDEDRLREVVWAWDQIKASRSFAD
ncbi:DnaJ domain-containing protein [Paracoccaceae bacterium GXU_MW_L88]